MRRTKLDFDRFQWAILPKLAAVAIVLTGCFPILSMAQQRSQKTFSSAEQASDALLTALQSNDEKALLDILGPEAKQIVSSGDDIEDAQDRANLVKKYQEMHRLVKEPDGTTTLYIGAENWPTPIPLVEKNNSWSFDTEAGKQEILFRRVGENELSTIRVCQELVAAEKEYYPASNNRVIRPEILQRRGAAEWPLLEGCGWPAPESDRATGGVGRCPRLHAGSRQRSPDPVSRLLLPGSDAPRGQRPGQGEKLHRQR